MYCRRDSNGSATMLACWRRFKSPPGMKGDEGVEGAQKGRAGVWKGVD